MTIPTYSGEVPSVITEQMIEVDRAMMEDVRIELIQMMENAGRNLAHLARTRFFAGDPRGKHVVVLAGTGGNGGGALVWSFDPLDETTLLVRAAGPDETQSGKAALKQFQQMFAAFMILDVGFMHQHVQDVYYSYCCL